MPTPAFEYQDPLPLGADTTQYRLLTREGVSTSTFEGQEILKVAPETLSFLAQHAFHDASFYLRTGHLEQVAAILADVPYRRGDEVAVLVNGLGATPKEELYLLYRRTKQLLDAEGIRVHRTWIGEYATSLEMAGASISLLRLDDELRRLVDAPMDSPFVTQR